MFVCVGGAYSASFFACAFFTCQESLGSSASAMQCDGLRKLAYSLATLEISFALGAHIHHTYMHTFAVLSGKYKRT